MLETDDRTKSIVDQILTISPGNKLSVFTSTFFADAISRLHTIARRIVNKEEPPVVMWNVRPSNTFNILHAVYCQKLKECIEMGFNCVVILYDKLVEKKSGISKAERVDIEEATRKSIKWFVRAGLTENKTEFLTESAIQAFIKPEDFVETITSLAYFCDFDKSWAERKDVVSFVMDNLFEIYYESVVNCDVVLAGDIDTQNIWGMLRSRILDKDMLPNYYPPVVLSCPTLKGLDGHPLSTSSDHNSLSVHHSSQQLRDRLANCSEEFLKMLFDFLIIPQKKNLEVRGQLASSFLQIKKFASLEEIRDMAFKHMDKYFYRVRGYEL